MTWVVALNLVVVVVTADVLRVILAWCCQVRICNACIAFLLTCLSTQGSEEAFGAETGWLIQSHRIALSDPLIIGQRGGMIKGLLVNS